MSYSEHTWQSGETITAAKMNNIEEGIQEAAQSGGGNIIVHGSTVNNVYTLDMTVQELYNAIVAGTPVYLVELYGATSDNSFSGVLCRMLGIFKYSAGAFRVVFAMENGSYNFYNRPGMPCPAAWYFEADGLDAYPTSIGTMNFYDYYDYT